MVFQQPHIAYKTTALNVRVMFSLPMRILSELLSRGRVYVWITTNFIIEQASYFF